MLPSSDYPPPYNWKGLVFPYSNILILPLVLSTIFNNSIVPLTIHIHLVIFNLLDRVLYKVLTYTFITNSIFQMISMHSSICNTFISIIPIYSIKLIESTQIHFLTKYFGWSLSYKSWRGFCTHLRAVLLFYFELLWWISLLILLFSDSIFFFFSAFWVVHSWT